MVLSAKEFVLEHLCPAMGAILANFMFSAPLPSLYKAYAKGSLGELNSLPWAFMTGNCFGWVVYSFLVTDYYVFVGNFPGLLLSLFYNACALKLMFIENMTKVMEESNNNVTTNDNDDNDHDHENSVNNKDTSFVVMTVHEKVLAGLVLSWSILVSIILFIPISNSEKELAVTITVNLNLVFFYGAPLSVIRTVIETRNTGPIHVPTVLLNTANGAFWAAYGLGVEKPLITAPNTIGAILGFVTLFLFVVFPRKDKNETKETCSSDEESADEI